jgi:hypothetical protein
MFRVKYQDKLLECDPNEHFVHPDNSHYDNTINATRCNIEHNLVKKTGCNLFLGTKHCVDINDQYKSFQTYFETLNKILKIMGIQEVISKESKDKYKYSKMLLFYNQLNRYNKQTSKKVLLTEFNDQVYNAFKYSIEAIGLLNKETTLRDEYREKCGCVYDNDHQNRIKMLKDIAVLLNNMVVRLGNEMFDSKITNRPSWLSSFYLKKCEGSGLTHQNVIGLELFRLSYYKPMPRDSSYIKLFFKNLSSNVYSSLIALKDDIKVNCLPLIINIKGNYESSKCIGSLSDYFSKDINDIISTELYNNVQSLLESESTYIDYTTCIVVDTSTKKVTNIQMNVDNIQKQVLDNYGYNIEKSYLELIISENQESAYKTCLESYKNNDRENFMVLCKMIDTLSIEEPIKRILSNLCQSLYNASHDVRLSTYPMANNVWLSMSKNKKLKNNIEATGNLRKDLPYMTKKDIDELIEALQELEEEIKKHKRPRLEK